ncbi:unnamed protein product, partial [Larinioides sclopetarius]
MFPRDSSTGFSYQLCKSSLQKFQTLFYLHKCVYSGTSSGCCGHRFTK